MFDEMVFDPSLIFVPMLVNRGQVVWKSRCYKACFGGLENELGKFLSIRYLKYKCVNFEFSKQPAYFLEFEEVKIQIVS